MKHEIDKVMKIVDELGAYLLRSFDTELLSLSVRRGDDRFEITVECPVRLADESKIAALREAFEHDRKPELEDYYWQLAGDAADSDALRLLSIMCDLVSIDYDGETLSIRLVRVSETGGPR